MSTRGVIHGWISTSAALSLAVPFLPAVPQFQKDWLSSGCVMPSSLSTCSYLSRSLVPAHQQESTQHRFLRKADLSWLFDKYFLGTLYIIFPSLQPCYSFVAVYVPPLGCKFLKGKHQVSSPWYHYCTVQYLTNSRYSTHLQIVCCRQTEKITWKAQVIGLGFQ